MNKLTLALLVSLFSLSATASDSVWKPTKKVDEMTDEVGIWLCMQKPTESNKELNGLHSIMCAVCEKKGRRGYAFFSDEIVLAGDDYEYRLIPEFASDEVLVYPAKMRSPEGMDEIEVFGRTVREKAWHFVDWANVQRHALSADKSGKELLLQLEHYKKGFHLWKYEMTGLGDALTEECEPLGM